MEVFFSEFQTPFRTVPFGQWEEKHYLPAVERAIELAKSRIEKLKESSPDTFEDFIFPFLESSKEVHLISTIFFNLHGADTNDEIEKIASQLSPLLSQFSSDLLLDPVLFDKIKRTYERREELNLSVEQARILEEEYQSFVRNGALLEQKDKDELRKVDEKLAKLGVLFGKMPSTQETNSLTLSVRTTSREFPRAVGKFLKGPPRRGDSRGML